MEAYDAGQRTFGESRPQEMTAKQAVLPADIRWHMIGHLQTNKVRMIAPFVTMIDSVDSARLVDEIDRQAVRCSRRIDILLEVHVADEDTKSGWGSRRTARLCSRRRSGFEERRARAGTDVYRDQHR